MRSLLSCINLLIFPPDDGGAGFLLLGLSGVPKAVRPTPVAVPAREPGDLGGELRRGKVSPK